MPNTETMADRRYTDDAQVRAMVALLETQSSQLQSLRAAVRHHEAEASVRASLDGVVAEELRDAVCELQEMLQPPEPDLVGLRKQAALLAMRVDEVFSPPSPDPLVVRRERLRNVSPHEVFDRAVAGVPGLDAARVRCVTPADLVLFTSPVRMAAALGVLLDNAARFDAGPIKCSAVRVRDEVALEVADHGPGLGVDDPESLFAPGAGDGDGPGIGLFLARMLAQSLGGRIQLADRAGGGTVATLIVPQRRVEDRRR